MYKDFLVKIIDHCVDEIGRLEEVVDEPVNFRDVVDGVVFDKHLVISFLVKTGENLHDYWHYVTVALLKAIKEDFKDKEQLVFRPLIASNDEIVKVTGMTMGGYLLMHSSRGWSFRLMKCYDGVLEGDRYMIDTLYGVKG